MLYDEDSTREKGRASLEGQKTEPYRTFSRHIAVFQIIIAKFLTD